MAKVLIKSDKVLNINFKKEGTQASAKPERIEIGNITIKTKKALGEDIVLLAQDSIGNVPLDLDKRLSVAEISLNTLSHAMRLAQPAHDTKLRTNDKSVVPAINELLSGQKTAEHRIVELESKNVVDSKGNVIDLNDMASNGTKKGDKALATVGYVKAHSGLFPGHHSKSAPVSLQNGLKIGNLEIKVNPTDGKTYFYINGKRKGEVGA